MLKKFSSKNYKAWEKEVVQAQQRTKWRLLRFFYIELVPAFSVHVIDLHRQTRLLAWGTLLTPLVGIFSDNTVHNKTV